MNGPSAAELDRVHFHRERIARELGSQDYVIGRLLDLIADVREALDDRSDADCDGDPAEYRPNWAMRLVGEIDRTVNDAKGILAKAKERADQEKAS